MRSRSRRCSPGGGAVVALPEGTYALKDFPGPAGDAVLAWLMGRLIPLLLMTAERGPSLSA